MQRHTLLVRHYRQLIGNLTQDIIEDNLLFTNMRASVFHSCN